MEGVISLRDECASGSAIADAQHPVGNHLALVPEDNHVALLHTSGTVHHQDAVTMLDEGKHTVASDRDRMLFPIPLPYG
jgi:hypothetical protein